MDAGRARLRRVRVALRVLNRPEPTRAQLPSMTTLVSTAVPSLNSPPPTPARLPRSATRSSARVPPSFHIPPPRPPRPPLIVTPSSASDPPRTSNTRLLRPPPIVSRLAPGPTIVVVAGSVSTSGPTITRIVRRLLPNSAGSNVMLSGPGWLLA